MIIFWSLCVLAATIDASTSEPSVCKRSSMLIARYESDAATLLQASVGVDRAPEMLLQTSAAQKANDAEAMGTIGNVTRADTPTGAAAVTRNSSFTYGLMEDLAMQLGIDKACVSDADCFSGSRCIEHTCRNGGLLLASKDSDLLKRRVAGNVTTMLTSSLSKMRHSLTTAFSVDWSWTNMMVIVPCMLIGGPLVFVWWQLDVIKRMGTDTDEIWTAHDENLREIDISAVGASGVALLRRHSDRQFGILFCMVGIMLQIVFLYFIALYSIQSAGQSVERKSPLPLMFCSMFCNSMTCCASFITGMKAWDTAAPFGYEVLHHSLVLLDSFIIPSIAIVVGSMYLCTSRTTSALVFSATSMAFVCRINMQIAGLMSWSLSAHGGRAFQPARVCIKDSVNTMQYAYYSLIGSAFIALAMMPVATLDIF